MKFDQLVSKNIKMRILIVFGLCVLAAADFPFQQLSAITFREYAERSVNRIIDGSPAVRGQIPWQVAVQGVSQGGAWFCGGSLISSEWVLTAAHCAIGAQRFILWFGGLTTNSIEVDRLTVESTNYIVHEGYNSNLNNDVAVIKLPYALQFSETVSPVRLPSRGERIGDGKLVQISGWGKTSDSSNVISDVLKYVDVTTIPNERCAQVYGWGVVIDSTLCAVGNPHHSTCNGDSGGPLVYFSDDGVITIHGVVSFVHVAGCASGNPSGYVRTESMLSWIASNTGLDV